MVSNYSVREVLVRSSHLRHHPLQRQLLLPQIVRASILNLELRHRIAKRALDLFLLTTLELHAHRRVRHDLLDSADVRLQLLPRLELLAESIIDTLELRRVFDHLLDLTTAELTDGVGDGDVGAAAGGLLGGGDLEDTIDVHLEDDLENGVASLHRGDRRKGEFAEGGIVFAVDTLWYIVSDVSTGGDKDGD